SEMDRIRSIGVVGGGTAGYFSAIALKQRYPDVALTLIESSAIPIIGVGEATTPIMVSFLHHQLGIDSIDFYAKVEPTWKLGIRFDWGLPGDYYFNYSFAGGAPLDAHVFERDLRTYSLGSQLMAAD